MKLEDALKLRDNLARRGYKQPDFAPVSKHPQAIPACLGPAPAPPHALKAGSAVEWKFALLWEAAGGPKLEAEYRFHPVRKWRADFAHVPSRTIIEIDGAVWGTSPGVRGGHDGAGRIRDCEKSLAAWLLGWTTVRLVPSQVTAETVEDMVRLLHEKAGLSIIK